MTKQDGADGLRGIAEARLKAGLAINVAAVDNTDLPRLVHELKVQQIELEIQNSELRRARAELEAAYEGLAGACPASDPTLATIRELKQQKRIGFVRDDIGQLIAESREGLVRVARIVSDLKNFSRAESADWQWADLRKGLESTLNIAWNEIKYNCTLHKDLGEMPEVYCIPSQLNQVFLNLLVNAAQAVPKKGEVTLRTGQVGDEVFIQGRTYLAFREAARSRTSHWKNCCLLAWVLFFAPFDRVKY